MQTILNVKTVFYEENATDLYYCEYNCGTKEAVRTTERSLELAIAQNWLKNKTEVVEIGAVSPYYQLQNADSITEIIDPADEHSKVTTKDTLFNHSFVNKNVLSISTLEHIGTGDYNNPTTENPLAALDKIVTESITCLITIPVGYNKTLDEYIRTGFAELIDRYQLRVNVYFRSKQFNDWQHTKDTRIIEQLDYGPLTANAVIIIEKCEFACVYKLTNYADATLPITRELAYTKPLNAVEMYPYFWRHSYSQLDVEVYQDADCGMHFVIRNGKKLYFPSSMGIGGIKYVYNNLCIESDIKSPHRYITDTFKVERGDTLLDVGAAEGFLVLDNIDIAEHAYIFEASMDWIPALEQTFAAYKHKVTIVSKFAGASDSENNIRIDSLLEGANKNIFVKIDTEGAERDVLAGMQTLLANNKVKVALCTYHKPEDAKYFQEYFTDRGYKTQFANGYVIVPFWDGGIEQFGKPSFRKGVLRCWQEQYFDVLPDNIDIFENEAHYKDIAIINHKREGLVAELNRREQLLTELSQVNINISKDLEINKVFVEQLQVRCVDLNSEIDKQICIGRRQRRHKQRYKLGMIAGLLLVMVLLFYIY